MIIGIDASRANLVRKTGTEWYSFYLIKNLAEIDHENTYWLYVNKRPQPDLLAIVAACPNFSIRILKSPLSLDYFWTLGRLTWEMLWRRPDVLFVPAHGLPLFGPRKTVNTIHDLAFWREQNLYRSFSVKTKRLGSHRLINLLVKVLTGGHYTANSLDYLYWSTAFALRHAKKIIAVSENTKREILEIYKKTPANKITVVPNGYNETLYPPDGGSDKVSAVLSEYNLPKSYLLYVGRLEKKKNTLTLVEAFALLKENHPELDLNLVLVGDAGFGYDDVQYTITEYNLENSVYLPGWVKEDKLPYIFAGAAAFIFPSKHEGFGIPILQAAACGVPVAVSDIPVLHEVAGEAALYFNHQDKFAIEAAMFQIVSDEMLRRDLVAKGLKRVKKFSWRRCAADTLDILTNL